MLLELSAHYFQNGHMSVVNVNIVHLGNFLLDATFPFSFIRFPKSQNRDRQKGNFVVSYLDAFSSARNWHGDACKRG